MYFKNRKNLTPKQKLQGQEVFTLQSSPVHGKRKDHFVGRLGSMTGYRLMVRNPQIAIFREFQGNNIFRYSADGLDQPFRLCVS